MAKKNIVFADDPAVLIAIYHLAAVTAVTTT